MCAKTIVASVEEATTLEELNERWIAAYQPKTPGQLAALKRCTYYELQLTRIIASEAAAIDDQVNQAPITWERLQQAQVASHATLIADDPQATVDALSDTAAGCRWMIDEWSYLKSFLDADGCWNATSHRDRAIRLLKCRPEDTKDEMVYWLSLMSLGAREEPDARALAWYMEVANMPDTLRRALRDGPPDREFCMAYLRRRVDEELAILREREVFLRIRVEDPARANAPKRMQVLEGEEGKRILGYLRANDTAFNRNYKLLLKGDEGAEEVKEAEAVATDDEEERVRAAAAFVEQEQRKVAAYDAEAALARAARPEIAPGNEAAVPSEGPRADTAPREIAPGIEANVPAPAASNQAICLDRSWLNKAELGSSAEWDPEVSALAALSKSLAIHEARRKAERAAGPVDHASPSEVGRVIPAEPAGLPTEGGGGGSPSSRFTSSG